VVQNVKVFLDPDHVVKPKIVAHLPHSGASDESEEQEIEGNVFETSNFEANEVREEDAESFESTTVDADVVEDEQEQPSVDEAPRFKSSSPIRQLKEQLARASANIPDALMADLPAGIRSDANAPLPLGQHIPIPANAADLPKTPHVNDEAAIRASHLYIGHEGPELPTGLEIKRPVDTSGTVGTEAGTDFDPKKKMAPNAKCGNGCQLRVPVMVGYVGLKERPATSTREVRMPGDRQRWRNIHQDLKTTDKITWAQEALDTGRKHLNRASRKIDNLRRARKMYEQTALNRHVVVPLVPHATN